MSYNNFNNFYKLLNGDLTTKIGEIIHPHDFMGTIGYFCYCPKVNGNGEFEGKCQRNFLIYEV